MRISCNSLIVAMIIAWCTLVPQLASADGIAPGSAVGKTAADVLDETGLGIAETNENLGTLSGRQETYINNLEAQLSTSNQSAQSNGNNILNSSVVNGGNSISDNAFTNANGFVTVIQNSGNQVLIQNDLIMNLTVK